ncbi:hypothetical protein [Vulcanisaeta distributa]|uniref:hypothetical protein n=1 Tax=Vulcanisaeta distributa TaxID=164451 RepID=UPI000A6BF90C|nr:hypothetical protein [Vulcanisaeta distributa]
MSIKFAEIILESRPSWFWRVLRQVGVEYVTGVLPDGLLIGGRLRRRSRGTMVL